MFRHVHARRVVLLLLVLAAAFMWTAAPGLRAAGNNRAEASATPATGAAPAAAPAPQKPARESATQKAQQTTISDATGRKHTLMKKVTQEERKAAANRLKAKAAAAAGQKAPFAAPLDAGGGFTPMFAYPAPIGAMVPPGEPGSQYLVGPEGQLVPDYSGLTANWAYSPTPTLVPVTLTVGDPLVARANFSDGVGNIFVIGPSPLPAGHLVSFQIFNQMPYIWDGLGFNAYLLRPSGVADEYLVVYDSGKLSVPVATDPAGEVVTFPVPNIPVVAGDRIAFYGNGIAFDDVVPGVDQICYPADTAPVQNTTITIGGPDFPVIGIPRVYSFAAVVADPTVPPVAVGGIRKFVDSLPLLGPGGANGMNTPNDPLGQYIPIATAVGWPLGCEPAACTADYYELELGEYTERMHSDLLPTRLRGYRQTNGPLGAAQPFHYLGTMIVASKGRPVRVKLTNNLPTGVAGNLFLPVDASVMGAGPGSHVSDATRVGTQPNVLCKAGPGETVPAGCYTQNRATIHLHGGVTPWISDGTTHQWISPAAETEYPHGVSVYNVPDMDDPGEPIVPGVQTFYYTNEQSARLMWYHDHAHGITRLNVYAGMASGYLLTDDTEGALITAGLLPPLVSPYHIPLIIQDKTFVDADNVGIQDPTWNWGTGAYSTYTDPTGLTMNLRVPMTGDLWWPHVYQPAQNPYDLSGYNATGRWNYGPWFFPPTTGIAWGPVANPYFVDDITTPLQPPLIPGTPNPSWGAEAFLDTPLINGTAYPTLTVEPRAYRFRILNGAHDRFWNLQLYKADTSVPPGCPTCAPNSEVKMVPAAPGTGLPDNWPQDGRAGGAPDPAMVGPNFIMIGTEGGFLPKPVVIPHQPVVWNRDPLTFNALNVSDTELLLGPAERADVLVDFTGYAGQTLILYNDAPAAFPALDPRNDYYTGNPDLFDTGGTGSTLVGFGPNTRTLMQIVVAGTAAVPATVDINALNTAWMPGSPLFGGAGVFEHGQDPIIVGQAAYNGVYTNNLSFPSTAPNWGLGSIFSFDVSFETVQEASPGVPNYVTIRAGDKAIHDEMGATFDEYGRMKASLGVSMPNPTPNTANFIMQGYADPATEIVKLSDIATMISADPLLDGTQIWRLNHNGVDTHPIHFHLFHVQLLNRVGWDGAYRLPLETELGWKDTVRVSPLEDTYVALRPIAPLPSMLPFKVPNSFRPLEPALPIGSSLGFTNIDPIGNPITPGITNEVYNFGWEYVWHCHILSHEENDMMRPVVFTAPPEAPTLLTLTGRTLAGVGLQWLDNSVSATSFTIERATDAAFPVGSSQFFTVPVTQCGDQAGCTWTFTDTSAVPTTAYFYRVQASNTVGSTVPNYPTITTQSAWTNTLPVDAIAAPDVSTPTGLAAQIISAAQVRLTWTDTSNNEDNFFVWRQTNAGAFVQIATVTRTNAQRTATGGTVTFNNTGLVAGNTYSYYVIAWNTLPDPDTSSAPTGTVTVALVAPTAPSLLEGFAFLIPRNNSNDVIALTWVDNATNEAAYQVARCRGVCGPASAWTNITPTLPADETSYSETRSKAFDWSYRVRATNAVGNSAWSNIVTVITP